MAAYSFQKRFIEPIQAGTKTQTIRAVGKRRHARPGMLVQIYFGLRTQHCRKILDPDPLCVSVQPVVIDRERDLVQVGPPDARQVFATRVALDAFAVQDGFADWDDMKAFWQAEHSDRALFEGLLITWSSAP